MRISVRTPMMVTGMIAIGGATAVSEVVPSMLFEELMLQRPAGDIPNLPFTTHPYCGK